MRPSFDGVGPDRVFHESEHPSLNEQSTVFDDPLQRRDGSFRDLNRESIFHDDDVDVDVDCGCRQFRRSTS